jgi:lactoylglutathione lyase
MTDSDNVEKAVPLYSVHDIQASLRFYVDGLGFRKTREWIDEGKLRWCWLELGTAAVMLQEWWKDGSHRNVPTTAVGIGVSMNFICRDALALYREFRSRDIQAKRPFVGNSMWVTEVNDPDGYALFFESPTEVTEGTEYTE